jgi:hypothetical protein
VAQEPRPPRDDRGALAVHVYAGPTLGPAAVRSAAPDVIVHDPVQHGDLLRAGLGAGDCAVLIDGYYHQTGAVRHKEILHVLDRGAAVVGAASMGAIRAAELHTLGMTGVGEVFRMYRDGEICGDDEVAVAHGEAPEFRRASEALVNIRYALSRAQTAGVTGAGEAAGLLEHARALTYTERSWLAIEHRVRASDPSLAPALHRVRAYARANAAALDLKAIDAGQALSYAASGQWRANRAGMGWREPRVWRTRHLYDWQAQFGGQPCDGHFVPDLAVARYLQLHDPAFPARWRSFVLARIAGTRDGDVARAALNAAAAQGLIATDLSAGQIAYWVAPAQSRALGPDELLLTVLVRSYRSPRGARDVVDAAAADIADPAIRRIVAEHYATNAAIAAKSPRWQLSHLNRGVLADELSSVWGAEVTDRAGLEALARDRGLDCLDSAVDCFRPFFLRRHLARAESAKGRQ